MIRTLSVPVEAIDTTLEAFAASIDVAVADACRGLEDAGSQILSILVLPMRTTHDVGDASRDHWVAENGIIAVITYRGAEKG
jgi:hypothetical protein